MRNGPEFIAIGVWCLSVAAIVAAQGTDKHARPSLGPVAVAPVSHVTVSTQVAGARLITGRSAAFAPNAGPYGDLIIDPSLLDTALPNRGPKPTSADLLAK